LVTFYCERHEDGKRVTEKLNAIDFIKRLIVHIPDELNQLGSLLKKQGLLFAPALK